MLACHMQTSKGNGFVPTRSPIRFSHFAEAAGIHGGCRWFARVGNWSERDHLLVGGADSSESDRRRPQWPGAGFDQDRGGEWRSAGFLVLRFPRLSRSGENAFWCNRIQAAAFVPGRRTERGTGLVGDGIRQLFRRAGGETTSGTNLLHRRTS